MAELYPVWQPQTPVDWQVKIVYPVVASRMQNRDVWQCKQKWMRSLRPGLNLGPWSAEEDEALLEAMAAYPPAKRNWATIEKALSDIGVSRSAKQIKEHWEDHTDPAIVFISAVPLTPKEWAVVVQTVTSHPNSGKLWVLLIQKLNDLIKADPALIAELNRGRPDSHYIPIRSKSDLKKVLHRKVRLLQEKGPAFNYSPSDADTPQARPEATVSPTNSPVPDAHDAPERLAAVPALDPQAAHRTAVLSAVVDVVKTASKALSWPTAQVLTAVETVLAAEAVPKRLPIPVMPEAMDRNAAQLLLGMSSTDSASLPAGAGPAMATASAPRATGATEGYISGPESSPAKKYMKNIWTEQEVWKEFAATLLRIMTEDYPDWVPSTVVDWKCQLKWDRTLRPSVQLGAWTSTEDAVLARVMTQDPACSEWTTIEAGVWQAGVHRRSDVPLQPEELAIVTEMMAATSCVGPDHTPEFWDGVINKINELLALEPDIAARLRKPSTLVPVRTLQDRPSTSGGKHASLPKTGYEQAKPKATSTG
ncbi:hypothetical protein ACHHYP_12578 [Achlya hypogyna]|uniref:Myb-like domain-containing protein n=1 Tax=Achlya hypogyna TaxID=1202772 RepID=A0A1V9YGK4_ACHHY|nr:hypothetical protein ACHHYP_12578 [Achlya hypogyna]